MKSKFSLSLALLIISGMLVQATGTEYTKNIRKGWAKSGVTELKVSNKFGEVKINDTGGDSVTIKVVVTIDNTSSGKAKALMDKISVSFDKSGGLVSAETEIEDGFRNNETFTIDYLVNIPKDRDLNITNKYGNVIVNELDAKGYFEVSYGSMTAGNMKAPAGTPVKLILNYGKANLESINEADMELKYSQMVADEIDQLVLDTKYSTVTMHKNVNLTLDSKYDGINIDELGKLKSISKYTNYKIGVLNESFDLDTGYGSVRINKVSEKFNRIRIENSYGGINIALNDLNYKLQAECSYCDVKYPENRYKGNRIKENNSFNLEGNIGAGGGSVSINSRYGGIKLTE